MKHIHVLLGVFCVRDKDKCSPPCHNPPRTAAEQCWCRPHWSTYASSCPDRSHSSLYQQMVLPPSQQPALLLQPLHTLPAGRDLHQATKPCLQCEEHLRTSEHEIRRTYIVISQTDAPFIAAASSAEAAQHAVLLEPLHLPYNRRSAPRAAALSSVQSTCVRM